MANTIVQGSLPLSSTITGTTASISATIGSTAFTGRCVYLTGLSYQADATGATTIAITATYSPASGGAVTLGTWSYVVGTGTTGPVPLDINLIPPFQSAQSITGATNTTAVGSITVTAGAAGTGGVAALNIWGYAL